ncbi:MAG: hypothetical protein SGBAC_009325 [Bacillariaceae sp.]
MSSSDGDDSPRGVTSNSLLFHEYRASPKACEMDAAKIVMQEKEQLEQVIRKYQSEGGELYHSEIATAYARISAVLGDVGSRNRAIELYEEALEIRLKIGGHGCCDYSDVKCWNADADQLESHGALQTHQEALDIALKTHGKDHPMVATSYRRMANILHRYGKLQEATQMFQQALVIQLKTLEKEYLDACAAVLYSYMGDLLQNADKPEVAVSTYQTALGIFTLVLESDDRWLQTMYRKLGDVLDGQGNDGEALTMYQRALKLELDRASSGGCEELQEAASIFKRIGTLLRKHGNHDFAIKMFEEVVQIKLKIQKQDYQGRLKTKLKMYEEYLGSTTKANGQWHPPVAMICIKREHLWNAQGKYPEAIQMYEKGFEIRVQFLGQDTLDTAILSNTMADVLAILGRWNEAVKYYKKSLDTFSAALGPYDPWVRTTYQKLEDIFIDQDKQDEALEMQKEVFRYELQETRYSATSKLFYGMNDEKEFTTKLYKNILEMRAMALSPEYPDSARMYNALGDLLFSHQHMYDDATAMYQEAHAIEMTCLGANHPDRIATRSILANISMHKDNEDEVVEAYHKALGIGLRAHIHDHPLIACRYHRSGNILSNQGRYKDAMNMYQDALEIQLKKLGYDHPDTTLLYNHMGHALANQGSYLEATRMFKRALQIWKKTFREDHPMIVSTYQKMVDMLFEQGKDAEAEDLYKLKIGSLRNAWRPSNSPTATLSCFSDYDMHEEDDQNVEEEHLISHVPQLADDETSSSECDQSSMIQMRQEMRNWKREREELLKLRKVVTNQQRYQEDLETKLEVYQRQQGHKQGGPKDPNGHKVHNLGVDEIVRRSLNCFPEDELAFQLEEVESMLEASEKEVHQLQDALIEIRSDKERSEKENDIIREALQKRLKAAEDQLKAERRKREDAMNVHKLQVELQQMRAREDDEEWDSEVQFWKQKFEAAQRKGDHVSLGTMEQEQPGQERVDCVQADNENGSVKVQEHESEQEEDSPSQSLETVQEEQHGQEEGVSIKRENHDNAQGEEWEHCTALMQDDENKRQSDSETYEKNEIIAQLQKEISERKSRYQESGVRLTKLETVIREMASDQQTMVQKIQSVVQLLQKIRKENEKLKKEKVTLLLKTRRETEKLKKEKLDVEAQEAQDVVQTLEKTKQENEKLKKEKLALLHKTKREAEKLKKEKLNLEIQSVVRLLEKTKRENEKLKKEKQTWLQKTKRENIKLKKEKQTLEKQRKEKLTMMTRHSKR